MGETPSYSEIKRRYEDRSDVELDGRVIGHIHVAIPPALNQERHVICWDKNADEDVTYTPNIFRDLLENEGKP